MRAPEAGSGRRPAHSRLRRVPQDRGFMGPSADVSRMWPRRLLRFVKEQACHEALPSLQSPDHALDRAGGVVELVLRGWHRSLTASEIPHMESGYIDKWNRM